MLHALPVAGAIPPHAQDQVDHQMKAVQPLVTRACELARAKGSGEALKLACLRAVRRFLELCHQLRTLPANLDKIEEAVLQNLDSSSAAAGVANGTSGEPGAAGMQGAHRQGCTIPGVAHYQASSTAFKLVARVRRGLLLAWCRLLE